MSQENLDVENLGCLERTQTPNFECPKELQRINLNVPREFRQWGR
jgi:hypothetical protein